MRKILIIIAILTGVYAQAQDQVFYYQKGEKIYLDKVENTKIVHFKKTTEKLQRENICSQLKASKYTISEITPLMYRISTNTTRDGKNNIALMSKANDNILYVTDVLMNKNSAIQWTSNEILVKIHAESDLRKVLQENKMPVVDFRQIGSNKQTYLVELDVTENSAIEYANRLSETGMVIWVQPSFYSIVRKYNAYYPSQWGLNNTGQYNGTPGMDINVTDAWNITTGAGVKVAVLDVGVDLTHPDLEDNLLPGYDATGGNSNGSYGGLIQCPEKKDTHGTSCAGIIAALDNNIGIKGVAYNSKITPIRIGRLFPDPLNPDHCDIAFDYTDTPWIIDGIKKAWDDYGADILSCSWKYDASDIGLIVDEIQAAVEQGRNSLGCVVVFASGNGNHTTVDYLASLPNVIGVAALVLSANPALTGQEVRNIIESTARKINPYHSSTNPDGYNYTYNPSVRPNGVWNEQVGYGLVDAYAAVREATCVTYLSYQDFNISMDTVFVHGCDTLIIEDMVVAATNHLVITAGKAVIIKPRDSGTLLLTDLNSTLTIGIRDPLAGFSSQQSSAPALRANAAPVPENLNNQELSDNNTGAGKPFDFTMYPNPTNGNFTLELNSVTEWESYTVDFFNSSGVFLSKTSCPVNRLDVNRSDLPDGVYFVKVSVGNNSLTKRLILKK